MEQAGHENFLGDPGCPAESWDHRGPRVTFVTLGTLKKEAVLHLMDKSY
jgi:hypothetical protein